MVRAEDRYAALGVTQTTAARRVRPLRGSDFAAVGRVAHQTGFFGESAARYFADGRLFADLWVGPYFEDRPREAPLGFAAELNGAVVGYIVGLADGGRYGRDLTRALLRRVLPNLVRLRYRRPWAGVPYLLRAWRFSTPHAPLSAYPAHLHINLLARARGSGLGRELLDAYLNALRARGVPGVQLSTTRENGPALQLYERAGFSVWGERELPLWTPWLGRPAVHVVMVKTLNERTED